MYPFEDGSMVVIPSTSPRAATSSVAIIRGALRATFASSNATGTARSPMTRFGGI